MLPELLNANKLIDTLSKKGVYLNSMSDGNIKVNKNTELNSNDIEEIKFNKENIHLVLENERLKKNIEFHLCYDNNPFIITPQQNQLVTIKNNFYHDYAYYIPFVIEFDKSEQSITFMDKFQSYIKALPIMKLCFNTNKDGYYLCYNDEITPMQYDYYLSSFQLDENINEIIYRPFKIGESLIRFGIIETDKNSFVYFVFHHIISDGWSLGNLLSSVLSGDIPKNNSINYGLLKNSKLSILTDIQKIFGKNI